MRILKPAQFGTGRLQPISLLSLLFLIVHRIQYASGFIPPTTASIATTATNFLDDRSLQILSLSTVSPPPQSSPGQIDLLEGKLKILEDVVKELHHRETEQSERHLEELEKLEHQQKSHNATEQQLVETINKLNESLDKERQRYEDKIKFIKDEYNQKNHNNEETIGHLQKRLSRIQEKHERDVTDLEQKSSERREEMENHLKQYEGKLKSSKSEIERLQLLLETNSKETTLRLQEKYESKLEFKREQVKELEQNLAAMEKKFYQSTEDLSVADTNREEQIEIAAAAVHAAETNEKSTRKELDVVSKQLTKSLFIQKILWLSVDALSDPKELSKPSTTDGILRGGEPGSRNRILRSLINLRSSSSNSSVDTGRRGEWR